MALEWRIILLSAPLLFLAVLGIEQAVRACGVDGGSGDRAISPLMSDWYASGILKAWRGSASAIETAVMLFVLLLLRLIFDCFEEMMAHKIMARHRERTVEFLNQLCTREGETKFRVMALSFVVIVFAKLPSNLAYYGRAKVEADE